MMPALVYTVIRSDGRLIETCTMVQTEYNEEYNVTKIETIGM